MSTVTETTADARPFLAAGRAERIAEMLRDVARGGLAGLLAGFVVGGAGGRVAMSIAALLNPQATGAFTENGEVVGRFTVDGTLALFLFGGLAGGMLAGVIWVVVSPWLPRAGRRRAALAFPIAALVGNGLLIESTNTDFSILDPDLLLIVLFLAVAGLVGTGAAWLDQRLDKRLPGPASASLRTRLAGYGVVAVLGMPALFMTFSSFFSRSFSRGNEPTLVGLALTACGIATVAWWLTRPLGSTRPAGALAAAGRLAVLAAMVLGGVHVWGETAKILALG